MEINGYVIPSRSTIKDPIRPQTINNISVEADGEKVVSVTKFDTVPTPTPVETIVNNTSVTNTARSKKAKSPAAQENLMNTVANPNIRVDFKGDFGTITSYYHIVELQEGFLVLGVDSRYVGGRYEPPITSDNNTLQVSFNNQKFLAINLGIKFILREYNLEILVLLINNDN